MVLKGNIVLTVIATKVMPYFRWLITEFSLQRSRFSPRVVHVGYVLDRVTLGQVCLQNFSFPLPFIIPCSFVMRV